MALVALDGSPLVHIGHWPQLNPTAAPTAATGTVLDAANEAIILVGRILTSDLASHTIDTTGSSSIGWRTGASTFANAGTTVKVGLAAVDTATGPPARAVNVADVVTFDVSGSFTGGGGGITTNAWQTSVPTAGTKTVAHGDLIALSIQMTARGGVDSVVVNTIGLQFARPALTTFTGAAYAAAGSGANFIITFSDGAFGYFHGTILFSTVNSVAYSSASSPKEYGQLFTLPFPCKVYGIWGMAAAGGDFDAVLYSDPLGTPVAEKTVSIDANTVSASTGRAFMELFSSPYTTTASQPIAAVLKPGGTNITAYYRTIANAGHRVVDAWGANGYGVSRTSGAFANANSSLDHFFVGLLVGAFDAGGGTSGVKFRGNMSGNV